jgi:predicted membrane protein
LYNCQRLRILRGTYFYKRISLLPQYFGESECLCIQWITRNIKNCFNQLFIITFFTFNENVCQDTHQLHLSHVFSLITSVCILPFFAVPFQILIVLISSVFSFLISAYVVGVDVSFF